MSYQHLDRMDDAAYSLELLLGRKDFTDDGYITSLLGSIYLGQGRNEKLLELSGAVTDENISPEYRNRIALYRAEALYATGDIEAAETEYSRLVKLDDRI